MDDVYSYRSVMEIFVDGNGTYPNTFIRYDNITGPIGTVVFMVMVDADNEPLLLVLLRGIGMANDAVASVMNRGLL